MKVSLFAEMFQDQIKEDHPLEHQEASRNYQEIPRIHIQNIEDSALGIQVQDLSNTPVQTESHGRHAPKDYT